MEYKVSIFNFDSKKHSKTIDEIKNAPNGIEKEPFFKRIALDILSNEGFEKVTEGPSTSEFQGVPFDFIAMKDGRLSLIELKGSTNTFNYSKEEQFARLFQVISELKNRKIESSVFLLQINSVCLSIRS
jgi:Holliday junction resolvase